MNILILEIGNFEEFKSRWHYFWNIWPREITYFKFYSNMTSIWKIVQFYYFINILDACEYNNISLFICSLKASQVQVELNHNISLSIHDDHHGGSTEGAGDIGRQRLTPGKSPTRSGGRSRRKPEAQFRGMNSMRKLKWEKLDLEKTWWSIWKLETIHQLMWSRLTIQKQ